MTEDTFDPFLHTEPFLDMEPPSTDARKERFEKDKNPIYPPELCELQKQLPDIYFEYLVYVLRGINYVECFTDTVHGKKTIYYVLDGVITHIENKIELLKQNKHEDYPMPIQRYRTTVLYVLRKYSTYFIFSATGGRIPIKAHEQLFDGID